MKFAVALFAAAAAISMAAPASATAIVANSGWQDDQINAADTPSQNSAWTFTIASGSAIFSVVDCCNTGDVYKVFDAGANLLGTSTFYVGSGVQSGGAYGSYWTDASYSKLALLLGAGSYSLTITGDGVGGLPAGLGVRLDTAGVPEPATWALMISGFGLAGVALRRRQAIAA